MMNTKFKLNPKEKIEFEEREIEFKIDNKSDKIKEIEVIIK